jgi:hypothetical protein
MVSENRTTPSVPQIAHPPIRFKPIHFTPHQVALMAKFAKDMSDSFVRAIHPYMTQAFLGYHLDHLVSDETPFIPRVIQNYFNIKPSRGGFTWIPR